MATDSKKIRVLPAKYNAYIAVKLKGSPALLGPKRFRSDRSRDPFRGALNIPHDDQLDFWYPIHKLFNGNECLQGRDIQLTFTSKHVNEKLRKIHNFVQSQFSLDSGQPSSALGDYPFRYSDNIANFDPASGLIIPVVHDSLVEAAVVNNNKITFLKPKFGTFFDGRRQRNGIQAVGDDTISHLSSSMEMRAATGARSAPEYLHIRERVSPSPRDLNATSTMMNTILTGNAYRSLHYVGYTGDGWVAVDVNVQIGNGKKIPAQSLVAAVDLFPYCEQTEVLDNPDNQGLWSTEPLSLADTRFNPNIMTHTELRTNPVQAWDTVSALVPQVIDNNLQPTSFRERLERRVTYLPDGANGIFAPGWDTSFDINVFNNQSVVHLSNYGLGSPFPEDAKLCAALSSYWPAVAPDVTRSYWPALANTIVPFTDEEFGANGNTQSWDGEPGPQIIRNGNAVRVKYKRLEYVDYTQSAIRNHFDYHQLANIDAIEYQTRMQKLALARAEVQNFARRLLVSYTQVDASDSDVQRVMQRDNVQLSGTIHKFLFMDAKPGDPQAVSNNAFVEVDMLEEKIILVDEAGQTYVA